MTSFLTKTDVARLMQEPSPDVRADVAGKLGGQIDSPLLTSDELALAQDLLRMMAKDVEVAVRRALSESLRKARRVPHDVAARLANDVEAVALPILTDCAAITDEDLIGIIKGGHAAKQTAIGARHGVSERVSSVLIADGPEAAVSALVHNPTARINDRSLTRAVERFATSAAVQDGLVRRQTLPAAVAERLVALVSEQLREYLVSHHDLPPALATDVMMQSRERAITSLSLGSTEEELADLVRQMCENGRLTPSLLLRMLCLGELAFFERALGELARVPIVNARTLIHDAGGNGLSSLYEKTGLPAALLPMIRMALDVVHETDFDGGDRDLERYRGRVIMRVLTQAEDFGNDDDLDYLLGKLGDVLEHRA